MARAETTETALVVLRGNSGSGKSSTALELRAAAGRGIAWVEQDYLRRIVLREHDVPDGTNIGLIDGTVRYALDHGYHVILDGIFFSGHYGAMLESLCRDHAGATFFYYFDVSFDETLRRHSARRQAADFGATDMRAWYRNPDPLGFVAERHVPESNTLEQTVTRLLRETGLAQPAQGAQARPPFQRPRCG